MLHVTNGDCAAGGLRQAGLPGTVVISADVLHDGPRRLSVKTTGTASGPTI